MRRANVGFNYSDYLLLPEDRRHEILVLSEGRNMTAAVLGVSDRMSSSLPPNLDVPPSQVFY